MRKTMFHGGPFSAGRHLPGVPFGKEIGKVGCVFWWMGLIAAYLARRRWAFDSKSGILTADEEYRTE